MFLYADDEMNWPGSPAALVGFSAEGGASSFVLPTSLTPGVLEVTETGNTGNSGWWVFRIDNSSITMPGKPISFFPIHVVHE